MEHTGLGSGREDLTLSPCCTSPQLEDQQTLEEAISVATAAMQQGAVTLETTEGSC